MEEKFYIKNPVTNQFFDYYHCETYETTLKDVWNMKYDTKERALKEAITNDVDLAFEIVGIFNS